MKRKIVSTMAFAFLLILASCGSKATSFVGEWVESIPGMDNQYQGIKLDEGGVASSINMATLVYESWKQENNQLIMTGKSIGNGQTIEFADTFDIVKVMPDSLLLKHGDMAVNFARRK